MKKELLIKLRDWIRFKPSIENGLCWEVDIMSNEGIIFSWEYCLLISYIRKHRPKEGKHFDESYADSLYYWATGYVEPRLDWLNDEILNFKE